MVNLYRRKVAVKIASGYLIIFVCILLINSLFIYRLREQINSISSLTEAAAVDVKFTRDIIERVIEMSTYGNVYLAGEDEKGLQDYNSTREKLGALLEAAKKDSELAYSQYEFESIEIKVQEFTDIFSQAVNLVGNVRDSKSQILDVQNIFLDSKLDELSTNQVVQSNLDLYKSFSNARASINNFQLNVTNYLVSYDLRYTELAGDNYRKAEELLNSLDEELAANEGRTQVNDIALALDTYYLGVQIIQNDTLQLNRLRTTGLEPMVQRILEQARGVDQKIQNDTQAQVMVLEKQLENTYAFFVAFLILLTGLGVWTIQRISNQITSPLKKIRVAADEIAGHDLKLLTSDLELLAQGNLAVGSGFISQPVEVNQDDEVGQVAAALNAIIMQIRAMENVFYSMADYLHAMSDTASRITHNQFNIQVMVRSEHDVLGNALAKMIDRLREANFQVQKQLIRLSTLRNIDALISININLQPTLQFIINQAVQLLGFTWGGLVLFDERSDKVKDIFLSDSVADNDQEWIVSSAITIRHEGHPYYFNDLNQLLESSIANKLKDRRIEAWYGAIVNIKGQFKGVIQVFHPDVLSEDEERIEFFTTLIGQVEIAIEHAELLQDLEDKVETRTDELIRRAVQTQTAAEISHAATSTLQLDELVDQSVNLVRERFDMYYVGLFLVGERDENAWLRAATGVIGKKMIEERYGLPLIETSMVAWTILRGKPRVAMNIYQDPLHDHNPLLPDTHSEVTLPLITRSKVIGALSVQSTKPGAFTPIEVAVLQTISNQLANAIANARLFQESQREKQFFESIVRTSTVAVVILDLKDLILVWNPAAEALFGWNATEIIGKRLADLVVPQGQEEGAISFRKLMDEGKSIRKITRRVRKDGVPVDVELSATLVQVEQGQAGILILYHDITELLYSRKVAETATQAKSEFLAKISHEIRTPMNAILGMSDLLLDTSLSVSQRDFVETIRSSSETLLSLMNDILDFSKIEARRLELDFQPFNLRVCIESAMDLAAVPATAKNLTIGYFIYPNVPLQMIGDKTRLRQVLINLLTNAVKFTNMGEVVLEVHGKPKPESDSFEYLFSVKDTGIGIVPGNQERLFQYFSQAETSISRKYGGSGLGLAISKQLVELMGGKIWVESTGTPGEGSKFSFTINAQILRNEKTEDDNIENRIFNGSRALVGMLPNISTDYLVRHLLKWGIQVELRTSNDEVRSSIQSDTPFSFILLDPMLFRQPEDDKQNFRDPDFSFLNGVKEWAGIKLMSSILWIIPKGQMSFYEEKGLFSLERPIKPLVLLNNLKNFQSNQLSRQSIGESTPEHNPEKVPLDILTVEDDPVNEKVFSWLLNQIGYQAETSRNGFEAIEKIRLHHYDIVFMDILMPGMDGIETTRRILEIPNIVKPFIVAFTADTQVDNREALLAVGIDAYLSKPVQLSAIHEVIQRACEGHERFNKPKAGLVTVEKIIEPTKDHGQDLLSINSTILFEYFPQLLSDDKQQFNVLIELFIEETSHRIGDLRDAYKRNDIEFARNAAHTIKGTSHTFGAMRLVNLAIQVENELLNGRIESTNDLINEMELELNQVVHELRLIGGS